MSALTFLENFDVPEQVLPKELAVEEQPGYQAGVAAGRAEEQQNQTALRAELIEKISDLTFVYAEARSNVLQSLSPLFGELANVILPALTEEIAKTKLVQTLELAAADDSKSPFCIQLAQSDVMAFENALPDALPLPVTIKANSTLFDGEIRLEQAESSTVINSQHLVEEIRSVLRNIADIKSEKANHG